MKRRKHDSKGLVFSLVLLTLFLAFSIIPSIGIAEEETDTLATLRDDANILWTCLAAFIVFFMQAGFALVESGFTRAKNVCNIIMTNLMDISLGSIIFWAIGFYCLDIVNNRRGDGNGRAYHDLTFRKSLGRATAELSKTTVPVQVFTGTDGSPVTDA